nr:MAG TPA: hypothetical protein [Caudoviricetes sp.]
MWRQYISKYSVCYCFEVRKSPKIQNTQKQW